MTKAAENTLTAAMDNASQALEQAQADEAISAALPEAPTFTTHSNSYRYELAAKEHALKEIIADIDAKISALNSERTDAMLAYSGVSAAMGAIESGK